MVQQNTKTKVWKWILVASLLLVVLVSGIAVYLNHYWRPILTERIKEAVYTATDSLYRVDFENIRVNFVSGTLNVSSISLTPDTLVYEKMKLDSTAPRHLYNIQIAELTLKRIQPWKIYTDGKLEIKAVEIDKPSLQMVFSKTVNNSLSEALDTRTAYQRLEPYLNSVKIGSIIFKNADFKYVDRSAGNGAQITELKDLYLKVSDLLIDSASQFDRSRLYYTKDIYAEVMAYNTITADKNYTIQFKEFKASTAGKYARIKDLKLLPGYSEMAFSHRFKYRKDRYYARFEDIELKGIDYKQLNRDRRLVATALTLNTGLFSVFLNRAKPDSIRNKGANFPQLALKRFNLDTTIDTIYLNDSRINYSEYNPDSRQKGTLTFSKINGNITNVTNDSLSLAKNNFSEVKLTSLLMARGRMDVGIKFNLSDPNGAFDFSGQLGKLDADMLNPAIRPLSLIEIKSGNIQKMTFSGKGSIKGVRGSLTCYYNDLKVNILERREESSLLKRKGIASIFANILIVKNDNPIKGEPVRREQFAYIRPIHSSFFNMIWKGISQSLLSTIGFDKETQRKIQSKLKKMENDRDDREDRRDDRLKNREVRRNNREENN